MNNQNSNLKVSDPRQRLRDLRRSLLHLHKTLLDSEREVFEQAHGRQTSGQMLQLVIGDKHFAWLHAISEIIVRIDEFFDADESDAPTGIASGIAEEMRRLLRPSENGSEFEQKYFVALQREPAAVLAHRQVIRLLDS